MSIYDNKSGAEQVAEYRFAQALRPRGNRPRTLDEVSEDAYRLGQVAGAKPCSPNARAARIVAKMFEQCKSAGCRPTTSPRVLGRGNSPLRQRQTHRP